MAVDRIHLLEPRLANQIAAGEVIERPASVVKELIENSLDAGATRIEIDIEKGGLQLIRIRDDGIGIHPDDLSLAVSRHATSKVTTLTDLEHLQSLGFRGEALASICSISRFALTSCTAKQDTGWQVRVEGREMKAQLTPAAHPRGTTVEVAELFFNTPARRKFMRSEQTEWNQILELVKRVALSRFEVSFYLNHQQKNILQLRMADSQPARIRRLQDICGVSFIKDHIALDVVAQDLKLWGWVGLPDAAPTQPSPQYFYVNGRMIRDKLLLHAVRQAYEGLLPVGRHPVYVLYLEVEPAAVDVNVHPTKHEVRFRESRLVHDFVFSSIKRTITKESYSISHPPPYASEPVHQVAEQMALYNVMHGSTVEPLQRGYTPAVKKTGLETPLGQLHSRYLLIQQPTGLGIIDLALAYELLSYQTLQQAINNQQALQAQPLLIPVTMAATEEIQNLIEAKQELLRCCGLDIASLGDRQIVLRALPGSLRNADTVVILEMILALLKQQQSAISAAQILKVLAKGYFIPEKRLTSQEIDELLLRLADEPVIRQQCAAELPLQDIKLLFAGAEGCR